MSYRVTVEGSKLLKELQRALYELYMAFKEDLYM